MDTPWTGRVFVFDSEDGDDFASLTVPPNVHSRILAFRVRGPCQPTLPEEGDKVANLGRWISEMNKVGFTFVLDRVHQDNGR
jgi:hypothetical protein